MNSETQIQQTVLDALQAKTALAISAGNSKAFYGREPTGQSLSLADYQGIIQYEPSELVITARAGTPLAEINQALAGHRQELAFEPPAFADNATIGGTVACGLAGPARPWRGAVKDSVLGVKIINGRGEILSFGGQVMKNVAGYDAFRLMVGALGTLGVLLEVSLKVQPSPEQQLSMQFSYEEQEALQQVSHWTAQAVPLTAASYHRGQLTVRLSGAGRALQEVEESMTSMGGQKTDNHYWTALREQQLDFFSSDIPLWRISLPANRDASEFSGERLVDWGGQLVWLKSDQDSNAVRQLAQQLGGHATLFRHGDRNGDIFHPLADGLQQLHQRLKQAFDPERLFNPGRLYPDL